MIASHKLKRQIRFAETDKSGFAYFACYIRLMEETEYSFLRSRDLNVVLNDQRGIIGFPRLSAKVDVESPVQFGDTVIVDLSLTEVDGKRIVYRFVVKSSSGRRIATGQFDVACCRFPSGNPPYAILTPDFVVERLTQG